MQDILVSIVVVSYNSSTTIIETLESIRKQTYQNIELIVSDDCSKDNTVAITQEWLSRNGQYFSNAIILKADKNQGVCRNFNNAISKSRGKWIKIIAADDILFPNCIADYIQFSEIHKEARFITSVQKVYNDTFEEKNCVNASCIWKDKTIFEKSAKEQLRLMAYIVFVSAPTMFFKKELFDEVGGFDEQYAYEDHPFYINILENGNRIYFLDKVTVAYRVHNSVFNSNTALFNHKFSRESYRFRKQRCFRYYNTRQQFAIRLYYKFLGLVSGIGLNKKTKTNSFLYNKIVSAIFFIGKMGM